jgi:hypothetical protein
VVHAVLATPNSWFNDRRSLHNGAGMWDLLQPPRMDRFVHKHFASLVYLKWKIIRNVALSGLDINSVQSKFFWWSSSNCGST